jgi:hypothetical protein
MTKVIFTGWRPGVRKIRFIMLLHEKGGLSLRESKAIKDKVIGGGETEEVDFKDTKLAELIYTEACKLGVKCELSM